LNSRAFDFCALFKNLFKVLVVELMYEKGRFLEIELWHTLIIIKFSEWIKVLPRKIYGKLLKNWLGNTIPI